MYFHAPSSLVKNAIKKAANALPSRSTLPVLESLLFQKDGKRLKITGTDLEVRASQYIPVQFKEDFEDMDVCVPVKRVKKLLGKVDGPMSFKVSEKNGMPSVKMQTDKGSYEIAGQSAIDYPDPPSFDEAEAAFDMGEGELARAFNSVLFAVSDKDASRESTKGVCLDANGGYIVGTDGHTISWFEHDFGPATGQYIVPTKGAEFLADVGDEPVRIEIHGGQVYARGDGWELSARLVDATYPNYLSVIPDPGDKVLTVNAEDLKATVGRVGLFASTTTNQVRVSLSDNTQVAGQDFERAAKSEEVLEASYDGEDMDIGFNSEKLINIAKHLAGPVDIHMTAPKEAVIFRPREQPKLEMLVMPVTLREQS